MELEALLDTNNPKIKEIVESYKYILETYQRIVKAYDSQYTSKLTSNYGLTHNISFALKNSSSTDNIIL